MIRSRASLPSSSSSPSLAGLRARPFVEQLPSRPREREPFDEQQVLDPKDELEIGAAIDPRPAFGLRHAEIRELRLPGPQYVRLDLGDLAHLRLPE